MDSILLAVAMIFSIFVALWKEQNLLRIKGEVRGLREDTVRVKKIRIQEKEEKRLLERRISSLERDQGIRTFLMPYLAQLMGCNKGLYQFVKARKEGGTFEGVDDVADAVVRMLVASWQEVDVSGVPVGPGSFRIVEGLSAMQIIDGPFMGVVVLVGEYGVVEIVEAPPVSSTTT